MVDANYLEYGTDALRVTDSFGDVLEFGSQNGFVLGTLIGIFIAIFFVLIMLALLVRHGKKLLP